VREREKERERETIEEENDPLIFLLVVNELF
jgi:hypothetical protein